MVSQWNYKINLKKSLNKKKLFTASILRDIFCGRT